MKKKSQEERIKRIPIHEQSTREPRSTIQENTSKNQIEEVKTVLTVVQKKEEKATHAPYRHPNYNHHFDKRQGQNEYSQKTVCGHAKISTYQATIEMNCPTKISQSSDKK